MTTTHEQLVAEEMANLPKDMVYGDNEKSAATISPEQLKRFQEIEAAEKAAASQEQEARFKKLQADEDAYYASQSINPLYGAAAGAAAAPLFAGGAKGAQDARAARAAEAETFHTAREAARAKIEAEKARQIADLSTPQPHSIDTYMDTQVRNGVITQAERNSLKTMEQVQHFLKTRVTPAAIAGTNISPGTDFSLPPPGSRSSLMLPAEYHAAAQAVEDARVTQESADRIRARGARDLADRTAELNASRPPAPRVPGAVLRGAIDALPGNMAVRAGLGGVAGERLMESYNKRESNTPEAIASFLAGLGHAGLASLRGKPRVLSGIAAGAGEFLKDRFNTAGQIKELKGSATELKNHFNDAAAERKAAGGSVQHFATAGVVKKVGQELIGRGVDAAMPALQKLFSSGRDINEVKRLFDIAKTDPSRASQEAAGLYHDVGVGKKIKMPVELMTRTVIPNPKEPLAPVKVKNWEDLQGGVGMGGGWDKSGAGLLVDSNGNKFSKLIELQAGQDFIRSHSSLHLPGDSSYGASGPDVITRFSNMAKKAASQKGQDPSKIFHIPLTMTHLGSDFNTMVSDVLLDRLDPSKIPAHLKDLFFADMRSYVPNKKKPDVIPGRYFPHIDDEGAVRAALMAPGAGELRKAFARRSALDQYQNGGFPDVVEARFATSAPELLHTPAGMGGFNIATMDPTGKIISNPRLPHNTYPVQGGGDYFGTLPEGQQLNYKDIYQTWADDRASRHAADKTKALPKDDWFTFGKQLPTQNFDQQWLDRVKNTLGENRPREWADGGEVEPQGGLDALDRAYA